MSFSVPVEIGDSFEVRMMGFLHGQECITTFRYGVTATTGPELSMSEIADAFEAEVWGELRMLMSSEYAGARFQIQKIDPERYLSFEFTPGDTTGAVAGQSLPSGAAWVFRRRLIIADRQHRGRIYLPAIPVASEDNSRISSAVMASLARTNAEVAMTVTLTPTTATLRSALIVPTGAGTYINRGFVFDGQADPIIRYQRRREVGRGV